MEQISDNSRIFVDDLNKQISMVFNSKYFNQLKTLVQSYLDMKKQFDAIELKKNILLTLVGDQKYEETISHLLDFFKKQTNQKQTCSKEIVFGQLSFQCLDCGIDKDSHLLCSDCFSTQLHQNHKIQYSTDNIGICDCGDYQAIKSQGCCQKHKKNGNSSETFLNKQYIWEKYLPENLRQNFQHVFQLLFQIGIEKSNEIKYQQEKLTEKEELQQCVLQEYMYYIFELINYFCSQSSILASFMGHIFTEKIGKSYNYLNTKKLKHQCQDISNQQNNHFPLYKNKTNDNQQSLQQSVVFQKCECMYIEQFFRLSPVYDKEVNTILSLCFVTIMKNDENFQNILVITYSKMFNFLIYQTKIQKGLYVTDLFDLYNQFFTISCSELWLKDSNLPFIFEQTKQIINLYFTGLSRFAYNVFNKIKNIYIFWLQKESFQKVLNYKTLIQILSELLFLTQKKRSPHLEDEIEKCRLHIECSLLMISKLLISKIVNSCDEKKNQLLEYFLETLIIEAQEVDYTHNCENEEKFSEGYEWPIHFTGFRVIGIVMNVIILNQSSYKLKQLLQEHMKSQILEKRLIENMVICSLKAIKFAKSSEEKVGNFYEMLINPQKSMKIEIINSFYKKSYYGQYDLDLALIQTLFFFTLQNDQSNKVSLMSTISEIYGEIDIKKIYFNCKDNDFLSKLGKVLELIIVLIIDSTSFINSVACTKIFQQQGEKNRPEWIVRHLDNVIINSFHIKKSKDLRTIKEVLFDKILNYDIHLEDFINNVSSYNQNSNNLRIKLEYENVYEPFIFNKYKRLSQELVEKIQNITNKNKELDTIVSTMEFYDRRSFLRQVMDILFSDEVPRYAMLCFRIDGLMEKNKEVLKNAVKLVSLYLQFCQREIEFGDFCEERIVFDNLLKYYLKPDMEVKIEEMKNNEKLADLKQTFVNIQKIIQSVKNEVLKRSCEKTTKKLKQSTIIQEQMLKKVYSKDSQKQPIKDKEKLLQQKKEQIRKNFLLKQKNFMNKNHNLVQNLPETQEQSDNTQNENEVCNICHDLLVNTEYGVNAYLSRDNLIKFSSYYSPQSFTELDHQNINKIKEIQKNKQNCQDEDENEFGFNIQSCNHFLHKNCNSRHAKNNLKHIYKKQYLFTSELETLCGHCKFMSNIFIQFMDESKCVYFRNLIPNKQPKLLYDSQLYLTIQNKPSKEEDIPNLSFSSNSVSEELPSRKNQIDNLIELTKQQPIKMHNEENSYKVEDINQLGQVAQNIQQSNCNQNIQKSQTFPKFDYSLIQHTNIEKQKKTSTIIKEIQKNVQNQEISDLDENIVIDPTEYLNLKNISGNNLNSKCSQKMCINGGNGQNKSQTYFQGNFKCQFCKLNHEAEDYNIQEKANLQREKLSNFTKKTLEILEQQFRLKENQQQIQFSEKIFQQFQRIFNLVRKLFILMVTLHFISYTEKQNPNMNQRIQGKNSSDFLCPKEAFISQSQIKFVKCNHYSQKLFNRFLENEDFKYELINFLLPFCRKFIGIFFTIFKSKKKDIDGLDMDAFGSDFNEFDGYVKFMDDIDPQNKTFHLSLDNEILNLVNKQESKIIQLKKIYRTGYQNFQIVFLPANYLEFQKFYNSCVCDICQDFPRLTVPYLCLVCEKVYCSVKCYKHDELIEPGQKRCKKQGNLNKHAIKKHQGKCAFLHLSRGVILLVNYPKIVSYGHMYQDVYGQLPNIKNQKWEDFQLNYKLYNRIQELIITQRIPQEITYKLMKDELCLFQQDYV